MKQLSILQKLGMLCSMLAFCSQTQAQTPYWQQAVDYRINVSLNDHDHTLDGFIKINYANHSPDTLTFIWFHLWPNAYKNDKTAFSDQLLENGRTDFYFSNKDERGYINALDFKVDGEPATTEDHPEYIDIIKLLLPYPLAPGKSIEISTGFHEKLPDHFSRSGHKGQSYQIAQWYPKPAVYDADGWHPMPYLDQGEFYSEFGRYEVNITLPKSYVVAATGSLEKRDDMNKADAPTKTLTFIQDSVHDFAWFADKTFTVESDTVVLSSGRVVNVSSYHFPTKDGPWKKSVQYAKNAIRFYSELVGDYPYHSLSIVESELGFQGGMEYPTISSISVKKNDAALSTVIFHEVGHNWFYGILGSNERIHPWMVEGMNTFYVNRYEQEVNTQKKIRPSNHPLLPENLQKVFIASLEKTKLDQPVNLASPAFTKLNYSLFPYQKAADWMELLQVQLGTKAFDGCMKDYFINWGYKHPSPSDFKRLMEAKSGKHLDSLFALLATKGPLTNQQSHNKIHFSFILPPVNTAPVTNITLMPAVGYNVYDQWMVGALIHNYSQPPTAFQFVLAPLYATASKQLNGIGALSYSWYPNGQFQKIRLSLSGARFSSLSGTDSSGHAVFGGFYKIAPAIRLIFRNPSARSQLQQWIEFKTYLIGEKSFTYNAKSTDSLFYPAAQPYASRYLNQLTYQLDNYRALYPYSAQVQFQQASNFYRLQFTGNYFFNYDSHGGMNVRFFAAKFGYLGEKTTSKQFETFNYQPKLTATRGNEDYTYSNYFIGRNESTGFPSQQIMMKDGGLKLRTDLFQDLQGRSDNWISSVNLNTTLPNKLFPVRLPIKIFLDIGTYAGAWGSNPPTSRFLYVGGIQISLLRNIINVYIPLVYSPDFSNSLKTVPEENTFWKKISFSVDIQQLDLRKLFKNIPIQ